MADILITEFMDTVAVDSLRADFDVHYDPDLYEDARAIAARLGAARCADRPQPHPSRRPAARGRAGGSSPWVASESASTTSISMRARRAAFRFTLPLARTYRGAEYVIATTLMMLRGFPHR